MIIKNGHIMDPASGKSYFADIKITDGVIGKIADNIDASDNEEIIDAKAPPPPEEPVQTSHGQYQKTHQGAVCPRPPPRHVPEYPS